MGGRVTYIDERLEDLHKAREMIAAKRTGDVPLLAGRALGALEAELDELRENAKNAVKARTFDDLQRAAGDFDLKTFEERVEAIKMTPGWSDHVIGEARRAVADLDRTLARDGLSDGAVAVLRGERERAAEMLQEIEEAAREATTGAEMREALGGAPDFAGTYAFIERVAPTDDAVMERLRHLRGRADEARRRISDSRASIAKVERELAPLDQQLSVAKALDEVTLVERVERNRAAYVTNLAHLKRTLGVYRAQLAEARAEAEELPWTEHDRKLARFYGPGPIPAERRVCDRPSTFLFGTFGGSTVDVQRMPLSGA